MDCFQLLAIMYKAGRSTVDHASLLQYGGTSFGYKPGSSISGSSGRTISNFLRNCQIDFTVVVSVCNSGSPHVEECKLIHIYNLVA